MVTNVYIDSVMREIKGFRGTFSSNNAPKLKNMQSAILNFSKYDEEGTHFIAIANYKNKCVYFDPLSIKENFIPYEIKKYLKKYNNVLNVSKKIQNNNSEFCGFFCMLFIISLSISKIFLFTILSKFKNDSEKNDALCVIHLKKAINKYFKKNPLKSR
jgi:hypothetical protein